MTPNNYKKGCTTSRTARYTRIGCYLDRHFIEKADAERDEYYASMAESMSQYFKTEQNTSESGIDDDCPFADMADRKTENSSEKPNNSKERSSE